MKGINLSGPVHALVPITQIHVQTAGCSPLNPYDELLSDAQGSSSGGFHHRLHTPPLTSHRDMNSTIHRTICCTHWCSYSVLGARTWAVYHSAANWSSSLHPLSVLCLYTLSFSFSGLILFSWFSQLCPLCWLGAFSQTRLCQRIPNVYYQPSGCCQGINNHRIWWLLDEM